MEIRFQNEDPRKWQAPVMLVFMCEDDRSIHETCANVCPWLETAPGLKDFSAKKGELALVYGPENAHIPRVLLLGLGKKEEVTPDTLRSSMGEGMKKCRKCGFSGALLPAQALGVFAGGRDRLIEECVCAALLGLYRFTELKTDTTDLPKDPDWLAIGFDNDSTAEASARKGETAANAVIMARNLDNLPGNRLYPESFALHAIELAQKYGFKCEVMDQEALAQADMGCILAVGQGSVHPPRLIVLEHAPAGHEEDKPLILIGKGITFDSGGLCLKPPQNMLQMKCDMSGAAAVLAVITALAQEQVGRRVIGILACAENMPDGKAFRPGDVVTAANGQSVEVINTDAEGRLVLCDAIAWVQKQWTPAAIVDIATLTGACAVALGTDLAGLFCDDPDLAARIEAQGKAVGENYWQMPLWAPYKEQLKSDVADIKHTGAREGGAIVAALFLQNFVKKGQLWAHLDIAGVDWAKNGPLCAEGASGFGVRTLLALARGGVE